MPNGNDDIRNVWTSINALRDTVATITVEVGRIEEVVKGLDRLLIDRCAHQTNKIDRLLTQLDSVKTEHNDLKSKVDNHLGWIAGSASIGAVIGALVIVLVRFLLGLINK